MNEILKFTLGIFILLIIASCVEQFIPDKKISSVIKPAISVVIILSIVTGASKINLKSRIDFSADEYAIDSSEVWNSAKENTETVFENNILEFCAENDLEINDVRVELEISLNTFNIKSIHIGGPDRIAAKNLIAGHYGIGLAYIFTNGEN